jgi:RNA-binding protein 25
LNCLQACGPIKAFKRLITPANKPQGFGFAQFEDPDGALRAITLLNGVELPALEEGTTNKKLLVRALPSSQAWLAYVDVTIGQGGRKDAANAFGI